LCHTCFNEFNCSFENLSRDIGFCLAKHFLVPSAVFINAWPETGEKTDARKFKSFDAIAFFNQKLYSERSAGRRFQPAVTRPETRQTPSRLNALRTPMNQLNTFIFQTIQWFRSSLWRQMVSASNEGLEDFTCASYQSVKQEYDRFQKQ